VVSAVIIVGAVFAMNACSRSMSSMSAAQDGTGTVGVALQLGSGLTLDAVSYDITRLLGDGGVFELTGTLNVSHSTTVSGTISGLPAGQGYTLTFSGTTADGSTSCTGSGTFDVVARQTALIAVHLLCHEAPRTGSVSVNGSVNVCPQIDGLSANPAEVVVGESIALSGAAHDSDHGPAMLSFQWSATSGMLSDPSALTPTLTCTEAGPATVTLTVSDGDPAPGCADQLTATVTCTAEGGSEDGGAPALDGGTPAPASAQVQAILDSHCITCHSGAAAPRGLILTDVMAVVGAAAVECPDKQRITAGDSGISYLVDKIMGHAQNGGCFSGQRMPAGGNPPLSDEEIATIAAWIDAGAQP
jgi:hypothetical protein